MSRIHLKSLFVFRRDLRLVDNTALNAALKKSRTVIPAFIFDPRQVNKHPYRSSNALQFMIESLEELNSELNKRGSKLYIFWGQAEKVIEKLIRVENIEAIYINEDYTPFSIKRDGRIKKVTEKYGVSFNSYFDLLLTRPGEILTAKGTPYTVFSYFLKKARLQSVNTPAKNMLKNYYQRSIAFEKPEVLKKFLLSESNNKALHLKAGRRAALKILRNISRFENYDETRNFPAISGTTGLSAHNKFGTVSIREVYHAIRKRLGSSHTLIRELYWRDFFTHLAFFFPHVFGHSFHKKYDQIEWTTSRKHFAAWRSGQTGFPIVDAGMRELNTTGFMHNRVRMIAASFLVKDLHIDWRKGEKYFASRLVDYDPAVNNGNWQWAASTGCDAQPYFRIFNPWLQQKKFDPDCEYIKKWIPELAPLSPLQIHNLYKGSDFSGYPAPIVDHSEAREIAEELFIEAADKQ
ncbi:MAG: deoxyribodipyrimidine photo-lyase [Candidatus Dadabacteria bacterium]|nr:MAG: deoxyribodipyrimidine photo-lyase [Candidatus Dadabacteria bacterium]